MSQKSSLPQATHSVSRLLTADTDPEVGEGEDEARIRSLLAEAVNPAEPEEGECQKWFAANRQRFRGRDVYEAAHILLAADPGDQAARDKAKSIATAMIKELTAAPRAFAALARAHSACASAESGGALGQMSRGDLVDELETFILAMEPGQLCPVPVLSRHGAHVLRLDRLEHAKKMDFDTARPFVERELRARAWQVAVNKYLHALAERAAIDGVVLGGG